MGFSKFRELPELAEAPVDLLACQRPEAVDTKLLAAEAAQDRSINDGAPQLLRVDVAALQIETLFGQVADEAARETIARARRIEHFFKKVSRHHEVRIAAEQDGAVLAAFDDEGIRSHVED